MQERKIGDGSLQAFFRQGAKELAQALPAFKDSVQIVEESGGFFNPTTYDVSKQTGAVMDKDHDTEPEREP